VSEYPRHNAYDLSDALEQICFTLNLFHAGRMPQGKEDSWLETRCIKCLLRNGIKCQSETRPIINDLRDSLAQVDAELPQRSFEPPTIEQREHWKLFVEAIRESEDKFSKEPLLPFRALRYVRECIATVEHAIPDPSIQRVSMSDGWIVNRESFHAMLAEWAVPERRHLLKMIIVDRQGEA
jgi:hypothetical protein